MKTPDDMGNYLAMMFLGLIGIIIMGLGLKQFVER